MKNVGEIHNCYGCGVCASSCPVNIIEIVFNSNGFYEPRITDDNKCIKCGLCLKNCAFNHSEIANKPEIKNAFGAWSDDILVRRKCSSGGIGFELCRQLLANGYKIIACRYNYDKIIAEHYIATTEEELIASIGSKYIQSYTADAFSQIKRGEKYAIVGTPCQIDSMRRKIRKMGIEKDVILIDFFCHCVPSMLAWQAYSKKIENKIGKVKFVSWRNKFEYGWHDSWHMCADDSNPTAKVSEQKIPWPDSYKLLIAEKKGKWMSRMSQGDLFYKLFLGDVTMNPACTKECKYKMDQSSADIRLGDAWGNAYKDDENGVSAVIAFTHKGQRVVERLTDVTLEPQPFEVITAGQMKKNATPKTIAPIVMFLLKHRVPLNNPLYKIAFLSQKFLNRLRRYIRI